MGRQSGSASVELAVVLPIVALVLLSVAQAGLAVADLLTITHAAREGARVYSLTADPSAGVDAAVTAGDLGGGRATVTPDARDGLAAIEISAPARVFPGLPVPAVTLRARAVMRFERAQPT